MAETHNCTCQTSLVMRDELESEFVFREDTAWVVRPQLLASGSKTHHCLVLANGTELKFHVSLKLEGNMGGKIYVHQVGLSCAHFQAGVVWVPQA